MPAEPSPKSWLRESLRLAAVGLPAALLVSFLLFYALLHAGGLDAFQRGIAQAAAVPLLIALPLLIRLAVERQRLREARRAVNRAASLDPVTGVLHGSVLAGLVETRRGPAAGRGGAFLVIDASQLGAINRTYGFQWHDEALRHVAAAIRGAVRSTDLVARTGADAFGVFLGGASAEEALDVGERIRAAVSASYFAPEGVRGMLDVTVAGVTFAEETDLGELYARALQTLEDSSPASGIALTVARSDAGAAS